MSHLDERTRYTITVEGAVDPNLADWCGPLDGLVNAAGATDRASFLDGTAALWDRLFALNARAPVLLMQALSRQCLALDRPGSVVTIPAWNVHGGAPDRARYAAR